MLEGSKDSKGPGSDGNFGRTEVGLCCCVAQVGMKFSELLKTLALLPGAVTQLRLRFGAPGPPETFFGVKQSQARRGGSAGLPDVGEALAQVPDGVRELHPQLVAPLAALGADAQGAEIRASSFSLSCLHPGHQKTLSAQE